MIAVYFLELIFKQKDLTVVHFKHLSLESESDLLHEFFLHFLKIQNLREVLDLSLEITHETFEILIRFLRSVNYEN